MNVDADLMRLFEVVAAAGAVWGAIRADIRNMHEKIGRVEKAADEAHHRIDQLLAKGQ